MRALRYHGPGDLRLDDIPEPTCQDFQIKIQPAFVGICGTDLHEYSSATFIPLPGHPHPITGETAPCGFGHEFSGTVLEVGGKASGSFRKGDKVAVQPTICCFTCPPCESDYLNCCDKAGFVGLSGGGGGLSDAVCIDSKFVHKLPTNIDLDIGALVEPLAVAWHAVDASPIQKGDSALVLGAGPIGLGVIQCLKARGTKTIIVGEVAKQRQIFAEHFGATHILDPRSQDLVKESQAICGGHGPDIAFDCAGVAASLKAVTLAVRARGTIVNVAIWEKEVPFNPNNIVFGEKRYLAVLGYQNKDYESVIKALKTGALKPEKMITSKIRIDRVAEDGFRPLIDEKDKHVKILVDLKA